MIYPNEFTTKLNAVPTDPNEFNSIYFNVLYRPSIQYISMFLRPSIQAF